MDRETLAELRAVFADEARDHLESIRRHRTLVLRPDITTEERSAAAFEIFRAAHSLKGAARAIGEQEITQACHELEERLAPVRGGDTLPAAEIAAHVDVFLERLDAREPPAESTPRPAPSEEPSAPRELVSEGATMRVDVAQVRQLLAASDEMVTFVSGAALEDDDAGRDTDVMMMGELREFQRQLPRSESSSGLRERFDALYTACSGAARSLSLYRMRTRNLVAGVSRRARDVAAEVENLRLVPATSLCASIEHTVVELARSRGKSVRFATHGEDARLDRDVLERVREPLSHIARNAVDHGIESIERRTARGKPAEGTIRLSIAVEGPEVHFTLSDDGAGFDVERLRTSAEATGKAPVEGRGDEIELAFLPGVTTRQSADATSGRGMGLDIVRQRIRSLHGRVNVESRVGRGTSIRVTVPIQLDALMALQIEHHGAELLLPLGAVDKIVRPSARSLQVIDGKHWLEVDGRLLPLTNLSATLGIAPGQGEAQHVVVLRNGSRAGGLWVSRALDVRRVLARPLPRRARGLEAVTSAAISTAGEAIPVLDVGTLLERLEPEPRPEPDETTRTEAPRILVVDDSITTRQLIRALLEDAGYHVHLAEDGEAAWQRLRGDSSFDLVVSDIEMPHLDGLGLLERIRATPRLRDKPFILVTALADDERRRRAIELGADGYIVKSGFDQSSLLEAVQEVLG